MAIRNPKRVVIFLDDQFIIPDRESTVKMNKILDWNPIHNLAEQLGIRKAGDLSFTYCGKLIERDVSEIGVDVRSSGRIIVRAKSVRPL